MMILLRAFIPIDTHMIICLVLGFTTAYMTLYLDKKIQKHNGLQDIRFTLLYLAESIELLYIFAKSSLISLT